EAIQPGLPRRLRLLAMTSRECPSPELKGAEARQRQHEADDPEADYDRRFGPAEMLEMVVDRGHQEDALAGALVDRDLDDDAQGLDDEDATDEHQGEFVVGRDRHGTERSAERKAAGITH